MSLRIKLPPKPNEPDSHSEPAPGRRKKRSHLTVNSDDDDDYGDSVRPSPTQVNSDIESDDIANEPDSRFLHQSHSRPTVSLNTRQKRAKRKATPDSLPPIKRKRDISEQYTDDEYTINDTVPPEADMDDDEDFDAENKRHPKRARTKASNKALKGKATASAPEASVKEGHNTSSAKSGAEGSQPHSVAGSKRSRARPLRLEDAGDAGSSPSFSTHSPSPPRETSPPPTTKKRKLPPIKKNRPVGIPGASTPSNTSVPNKAVAVAGPPKQGLPEGPKSATVRKTPATAGNADFDLRNESVYRELFKPAGGSTPRSGLSRREKDEERRKELNKLRDEGKAKRLLEAKESFDLQAQFEKIMRFEERLKHNRSSALYPNFLAGKWREMWERERRHQRGKEWQGSRDGDAAGKEEGEMIEN